MGVPVWSINTFLGRLQELSLVLALGVDKAGLPVSPEPQTKSSAVPGRTSTGESWGQGPTLVVHMCWSRRLQDALDGWP